jgi:hypothetical protein
MDILVSIDTPSFARNRLIIDGLLWLGGGKESNMNN